VLLEDSAELTSPCATVPRLDCPAEQLWSDYAPYLFINHDSPSGGGTGLEWNGYGYGDGNGNGNGYCDVQLAMSPLPRPQPRSPPPVALLIEGKGLSKSLMSGCLFT